MAGIFVGDVMDLIKKEELASQVLAVIGASINQVSETDAIDILERAAQRVRGEITKKASGISQQQT